LDTRSARTLLVMNTDVTRLVPLGERPLHERVAANIRAEMARHGVTQAHVAALLGITQQSVSAKRGGRTPITLDELEIIAPLFGMTPDELLRGYRNPRPGGPDGGLSVAAERARRDSNPQPSDPKVGPAGVDELTARRVDRERRLRRERRRTIVPATAFAAAS